MADGGWIKVYRSIRSHWLWENGNERYAKWWIDILLMVNHEPRKVLNKTGKLITVGRGEAITSERKLSERWHADRRTVHKFLDLLQQDDMITVQRIVNLYTTLKVNNYGDYQGFSKESEPVTTPHPTPPTTHEQEPKEVINYVEFIKWFNKQTGKNFRNTETNKKMIRARLNEGFTKKDLVLVVKFKSMEWKDNPEMNKYLRFNTIFAPSHFNDYLNEANDYQYQHQQQSSMAKATDMSDLDQQLEENKRKAEAKYRKEHPELNEQ